MKIKDFQRPFVPIGTSPPKKSATDSAAPSKETAAQQGIEQLNASTAQFEISGSSVSEKLTGQVAAFSLTQNAPTAEGTTTLKDLAGGAQLSLGSFVSKPTTTATQSFSDAQSSTTSQTLNKTPFEFQMAEVTQSLRIADITRQIEVSPSQASSISFADSDLSASAWSFLPMGASATPQQMLSQTQQAIQGLSDLGTPSAILQPVKQAADQVGSLLTQGALANFAPTPSPLPSSLGSLSSLSTGLGDLLGGFSQLPVPNLPALSAPTEGSDLLQSVKDFGSQALNSIGSLFGASPHSGKLDIDPFYNGPISLPGVGSDGVTPNSEVRSAKYLSPQEISSYRQKIQNSLGDDEAIRDLARDDRALALATPVEKASMMRELMTGWTTDAEDRAMVDIAESCTTREEFDLVMKMAGGQAVVNEMDEPNSRTRMNILAGMWGRPEWANNANEAKMAQNALLDEQKAKSLANIDPIRAQSLAQAAPLSDQNTSPETLLAKQTARQNAFDIHFEPRSYKELLMTNAMRQSENKSPLDWLSLNEQVLRVFENDKLSTTKPFSFFPSQKELSLDQIRFESGLDRTSMREIFTSRYDSIFDTTKRELRSESALLDRLKDLGRSLSAPPKGFYPNKTSEFLSTLSEFFWKAFDLVKPAKETLPDAQNTVANLYTGMRSTQDPARPQNPDSPLQQEIQQTLQQAFAQSQAALQQATPSFQSAQNGQSPNLSSAMSALQQSINVATSAATYFAGAARGLGSVAMQGLGGLMHQVGTNYTQTGPNMLQTLQQSTQAFQALMGSALPQSLSALSSSLGQMPQLQNTLSTLSGGQQFLGALQSGTIADSSRQILQGLQGGAAVPAHLQAHASAIESIMHFANGLRSGQVQDAFQGLQAALQSILHHPALEQGKQALAQIGAQVGPQQEDPAAALRSLHQGGQWQGLLQAFQNGSIQQGAAQLSQDTQSFLGGFALQSGQYWGNSAAFFMHGLQSGSLQAPLQSLTQLGGLAGQAASQLSQLFQAGGNFFSGLQSGSLTQGLQGLAQNAQSNPSAYAALRNFNQQTAQLQPLFGLANFGSTLNNTTQQLASFADTSALQSQGQQIQSFLHTHVAAYGSIGSVANDLLAR